MDIQRVNTYDDNRFSQTVLLQHGCFLVDGNPYEVEIISDYEAIVCGADQEVYAELTKGQDVIKPNVTPEMLAGAITGSVSGMDGVDPEALKQFNQALIGLFTVKPTEDEHDGS